MTKSKPSFKPLLVTDDVEVARIDGALMFRSWDEVECDFSHWVPVDSSMLEVINEMRTASIEGVARALSGDSTHNLGEVTALAIVHAVRTESA
jgi:hypothetical protein